MCDVYHQLNNIKWSVHCAIIEVHPVLDSTTYGVVLDLDPKLATGASIGAHTLDELNPPVSSRSSDTASVGESYFDERASAPAGVCNI